MRTYVKLLVTLLACAALAAASCAESDGECYPTDWRACTCNGGAEGYQQCGADGAYGACNCSGNIPGLTTSAGTGGSGGGGGDGGKLGFMEPCMTDEQCETGLCHPFNAKGPHCSMPCTADSDCP